MNITNWHTPRIGFPICPRQTMRGSQCRVLRSCNVLSNNKSNETTNYLNKLSNFHKTTQIYINT